MEDNYYLEYYNYPKKFFNDFNLNHQKIKNINKIIDYENKLFNESTIELLPPYIFEYNNNEYYNVKKKIFYDLKPICEKYVINGGIIYDNYEYDKNKLINELINNNSLNNIGYRYNYEDGLLFKYQFRTNCTLIVVQKKYLKNFNYNYYNKVSFENLNENNIVVITYEDLYKLNCPIEYSYIKYFKEKFDINNNIDNIFHIYWKRILYIDYNNININIKKNNLKNLNCCIQWYIVNKNNINYNLINNLIDNTIINEKYNKNEYIKYFLNNCIFKINEINKKNNINIIKLNLNQYYEYLYKLNNNLNEDNYNLLSLLNNYDNKYILKSNKCDTFENIKNNIKENNINNIKKINNRINTLNNLLKKINEEINLLDNTYIDQENIELCLNRKKYLMNDINKNIENKKKIINQIEFINNNLKEEDINNCPVCLGKIGNNYALTDCGHHFCLECSNILGKNYYFNCPNCRFRNYSFNYVLKNKNFVEISENNKIEKIINYIKENIKNYNKLLVICNFKDTFKFISTKFNKKYKCSFIDKKIKKDNKIFFCYYNKLDLVYNKDFDEIIIIHPSLEKSYNELINYKFHNIKKSYFICYNTFEENII